MAMHASWSVTESGGKVNFLRTAEEHMSLSFSHLLDWASKLQVSPIASPLECTFIHVT